jgi:hypothetical protein
VVLFNFVKLPSDILLRIVTHFVFETRMMKLALYLTCLAKFLSGSLLDSLFGSDIMQLSPDLLEINNLKGLSLSLKLLVSVLL